MAEPVSRIKGRDGTDASRSGAIHLITAQFDDVAASETVAFQTKLPAGMKLELIAADARATAVTSDPSLTIGTAAAGAEIVAAVNLTTDLGALTLVATSVTSGDLLDIRLVADAGDAAESVSITLYGFITAPADSQAIRSANHY